MSRYWLALDPVFDPPFSASEEWKFHAAQLIYNSKDGDWASDNAQVLESLFGRLVNFGQTLIEPLQLKGLSVTLEESLEEGEHVHAHMYFHSEKLFHKRGREALEPFAFEGIHPHVRPNTAHGNAFTGAVRHGHFYVVVNKLGSLHSWTNFPPFQQYPVEPWWLDSLLKSEKIDRDVYLSYAARVGIGFSRRLADVRAAQRYEKERAMEAAVTASAKLLEQALLPMKPFPEVDEFVAHFSGMPVHRRPILAIIGGTNLGTSMLAADVMRRVAALVSAPDYLEITVEMNEHLDFSDFNYTRHAGIILDGVGDALILKQNREALQGRAKLSKGAQSATMMYSYTYTLHNRAIVATFDLSAQNLAALEHDHWLSNRRNVIQLWLKEQAFQGPSSAPPMPAPSQAPPGTPAARPTKRRWMSSPSTAGPPPPLPVQGH